MIQNKEQIKHLQDQIQYHNDLYWKKNEPKISDVEYDKLVESLRKLDPTNEILHQVHSSNTSTTKVIHEEPMLSLDKVYSLGELIQWAKKVSRNEDETFLITPKYDGIACKYEYFSDTNTVRYSTRGNGTEGEDITDKRFMFNATGGKENCTGEIVVSKNKFKELKNTITKDYKTERSFVVGMLSNDKINHYYSQQENYKYHQILDFVKHKSKGYITNLKEFTEGKLESVIKRMITSTDYPIDGIVFKILDESYYKELGNTSHHPRGSMAFKFTNPTGNTKLVDVEWQVGKSYVTPVGIVEPCEISGVTISKISLHNIKYIRDNDIAIGDEIVVERCGDVIPQYKEHISKGTERKSIDISLCPSCSRELTEENGQYICNNSSCDDKIINVIDDSCKRLGLKNIGKETIKKLVERDKICDIYDLLTLSKEQFLSIDRQGEKSVQRIMNEIENLLQNPIHDYKILAALNIPGIGEGMAKKILKKYSLEQILHTPVDFHGIDGIGKILAVQIYDSISSNGNLYIDIVSLFDNIIESSEHVGDVLHVCFTGKSDRPRSEWERLCKERGIEFQTSVNTKTHILVTNDVNSNSSKMKKAKRWCMEISTYDQFFNQYCRQIY